MSTILKWAGNKTAIMSELKKHLPAGPRLVEPFAGSCAVMMETDYPSYLVADINPDLINLYKKVAADCESFISRARVLFEIANREVAYYNIRQEFNYSTEITDFMKAVYFLYLNRHGYRGLCRYNKSGHFNIPYGNYKNPYFPEKEIRAFAEKAQRATFICASFDETLAMLKAGDHYIKAKRSIGVAAGEGKSATEIIAVSGPRCWVGFDYSRGVDSSAVYGVRA